MARISKQTLTKAQQKELSDQLVRTLSKMDTDITRHFMIEFFGPEEQIMLAKRLAVIALIHEKRPLHRIATYLHMSVTTVANLQKRYYKNEFQYTIKTLTKNKNNYLKFIDLLDSIFTVGGLMPQRNSHIKIPL